jgi:hypothetical protein
MNTKTHNCFRCGKLYKTFQSLGRHIRKKNKCVVKQKAMLKNPDVGFKCSKCSKTYANRSNLSRHKKKCNPSPDTRVMLELIQSQAKLIAELQRNPVQINNITNNNNDNRVTNNNNVTINIMGFNSMPSIERGKEVVYQNRELIQNILRKPDTRPPSIEQYISDNICEIVRVIYRNKDAPELNNLRIVGKGTRQKAEKYTLSNQWIECVWEIDRVVFIKHLLECVSPPIGISRFADPTRTLSAISDMSGRWIITGIPGVGNDNTLSPSGITTIFKNLAETLRLRA